MCHGQGTACIGLCAVGEAWEWKSDPQKASFITLNAKLYSGYNVTVIYTEVAISHSKTPEKLAINSPIYLPFFFLSYIIKD